MTTALRVIEGYGIACGITTALLLLVCAACWLADR
jgi:hypothetical protein